MKISYNWMKQFIAIPDDIEKHAALLTSLGLEVEGTEAFESIKGSLKGVIVGQVVSCEQHSNADKLKVTRVDLGNEIVQIVCGAPNVATGQKVPVATIGTVLYDAKGEAWTIKKGKIRGEESHGMICAEDELGLGNSHEGILILDPEIKIGTPLVDIYPVERDTLIEIGLTPNRSDAMSHYGVARDLRAGLALENPVIALTTPSVSNFQIHDRSLKIDVQVDDSKLAPRYCGLSITNITIAPSPSWLQNRLRIIGIAPKNNVVDITNYVMHELGQPLHAFDANSISGNKIIVKTLEENTVFKTLDGIERKLSAEDLMICDSEKPLCIAGVYGGANSGVKESTTAIFLESAYFNPVSIRKTAKRHGLNTDASFRFERGIDPEITDYALKHAAILIMQLAGGKVSSELTDLYPNKIEPVSVFLNYDKVNTLIGQEIPHNDIKNILRTLDIQVKNESESGLGLIIPTYRNDVTRPADVIEEILRVYGYDNINIPTKLNATIAKSSRTENSRLQHIVAQQLTGQGFYEMMANSLTSDSYQDFTNQMGSKNEVRILNPLSSDLSVLRQSMFYGALEAVNFNNNRKQNNLRLFEYGSTYHQFNPGTFTEQKHLLITVQGKLGSSNWNTTAQDADFFYLKGTVIAVLQRLGITKISEQESQNASLIEGIALSAGNKIADVGLVDPKLAASFNIDSQVLVADIYWDEILKLVSTDYKTVTEISKFPQVKRDLALLVNQDVAFKDLRDLALQSDKSLLKEVTLVDVYEGKNLPDNKKSYALSFILQDENKTLTDKQIDKVMSKIQQRLEQEMGAVLR